ncbi:helix-turn-helix domain-containing protein [Streptomyces sp. NPDC057580]
MAATLGVTPATLSRWETGQSEPRTGAALRWADLLDVGTGRTA